ncbi:MAG: hypothetical protein DRP74_04775 [Candidatus Omnitrophota bacterium]|nr:MAG: hypothetical protein DRP74_04775 [Candidatus Omnitrophota bacterium]
MAINVGVGFSTKTNATLAAAEAVRKAKLNLDNAKVDLAIVFSTVDLVNYGMLNTISEETQNARVIGCSGAAVISPRSILNRGLVVMLLCLPKDIYFNTSCVKEVKKSGALNAGRELAEGLLYGFRNVRRDLSIIFSDGLIAEGSNLIFGVQEKLGRSFPLVGASASDNMRFSKTHLFFNQEIFSDGAVGIIWAGKVNFGLGIKHGWKPLGKPRSVTESRGNIVQSIGNKPAIGIYEEYLNYSRAQIEKELRRISVLYPIGIYLAGEDEYLLRNIISIEKGGALRFQGNVPKGSQIRLMIGTKESCFEATKQSVEEAQKKLSIAMVGSKGQTNKFVLVFNSASRYTLLGREAMKEWDIIHQGFNPEIPLAGVYTFGEQAPLKAVSYQGQAYFHNQSIATLAMEG